MGAYCVFLVMMASLIFSCDFPFFANLATEDLFKQKLFFKILLIHAFTSTHQTMSMMFAHIIKRKYEPIFGNRLLSFVIMYCFVIELMYLSMRFMGTPFPTVLNFFDIALNILLSIVFLCFSHFVVCSFNEIADAVGVRVFLPKKKEPNAEQKLIQ